MWCGPTHGLPQRGLPPTGAALATTRALPALVDRFDGVAVRVPIPVGSIADIVAVTIRPTSVDEINDIFRNEAESKLPRNRRGRTGSDCVGRHRR